MEKAEIEWLGYHAFRRGLATNLHDQGVDDITIKDTLRHSDVRVTRASYITRVEGKVVGAMDAFAAAARAKETERDEKLGKKTAVAVTTTPKHDVVMRAGMTRGTGGVEAPAVRGRKRHKTK